MTKKYSKLSVFLIIMLFFLELGMVQETLSRLPYNSGNHGTSSSEYVSPKRFPFDLTYSNEQLNRVSRLFSAKAGRIQKNIQKKSAKCIHFGSACITAFLYFLIIGCQNPSPFPISGGSSLLIVHYIHKQDGKKQLI